MSTFAKSQVKKLAEKWVKVLDYPKYPQIKDRAVRENLAVMLENTADQIKRINETYGQNNFTSFAGGANGGYGNSQMGVDFPKLAIPLLRRVMPGLIANELVGVQPMTSPVGLAFALRYGYATSASGAGSAKFAPAAEAVLNLPYSGISAYKESFPTFSGETWQSGVGDLAMVISQQQISAGTRKLRTSFSLEMAQDIKALHNIDIDDELTNLLTYEIQAEIEQEIIWNCMLAACSAEGASAYTYPGVFGSSAHASANRIEVGYGQIDTNEHYGYRKIWTAVMDQANEIATQTRRGPANWIICSPKVATALQTIQNFIITPVPNDLDFAQVAAKKIGYVNNGKTTLYLDLFDLGRTLFNAANVTGVAATSALMASTGTSSTVALSAMGYEYALIGYKGSSELDAGVFYAPYVPILVVKAQDPDAFQPKIGIMSRYAIANSLLGQERYYRLLRFDFTNTTLAGL